MPTFDEILFDIELVRKGVNEKYPVTGALEYANSQPRNAQTGIRKTNIGRLDPIETVTFDLRLLDDDERRYLINFIRGGQGSAVGFRVSLPHDHSTTLEAFATGDGADTTFQLALTYTRPGETTHPDVRSIYKPVVQVAKETNSFQLYEPDGVTTRTISNPLKIYFGASEQTTGWTVNCKTGLVTFSSPPSNGVVISWTGDFDVPMAFDSNSFTQYWDIEQGGQITMRELLGAELEL